MLEALSFKSASSDQKQSESGSIDNFEFERVFDTPPEHGIISARHLMLFVWSCLIHANMLWSNGNGISGQQKLLFREPLTSSPVLSWTFPEEFMLMSTLSDCIYLLALSVSSSCGIPSDNVSQLLPNSACWSFLSYICLYLATSLLWYWQLHGCCI